jgi:gluconate 2-dehydrogenase gamma chain
LVRDALSRREFLGTAGSLGALWMLADSEDLASAARHAAHQVGAQQPTLAYFSREQAAEIEAMAERIIPADDTPGARLMGVLYFIDRGLSDWAKGQQPVFTEGLQKLPQDVSARFAGRTRLASLTAPQQDDVLRTIEQTPFFGAMRFATLAGALALPRYGGNRDFAGWRLVRQDTVLDFKPPFSWYDRPENRRVLLPGSDE